MEQAVIDRLRASKLQDDAELRAEGYSDGHGWAMGSAEAKELERLCTSGNSVIESDYSGEFGHGYLLYTKMCPEGDVHDAHDFWCEVIDEDDVNYTFSRAYDRAYLRGFIEGAQAVWREVEPQLN